MYFILREFIVRRRLNNGHMPMVMIGKLTKLSAEAICATLIDNKQNYSVRELPFK